MEPIKIMILGPRKAGKTIYLASFWKRLSLQRRDVGFYLQLVDQQTGGEDSSARALLNDVYTQIVSDGEFPPGNDWNVSEYTFQCCTRIRSGPVPVLAFQYYDYAGGRLTDTEINDPVFNQHVSDSDVFLLLFDGEKILRAMADSQAKEHWVHIELASMLQKLQSLPSSKIMHIAISKWDLFGEDDYEKVREFLMEIEDFGDFLSSWNSRVRLIPISALGRSFVRLQNGDMTRVPSGQVMPVNIEFPLAASLIDRVAELKEQAEREATQLAGEAAAQSHALRQQIVPRDTEVSLGAFARRGSAWLAKLLGNVQNEVGGGGLDGLIGILTRPQRNWEERQLRTLDDHRKEIELRLANVKDQKGAVEHVFNSFQDIVSRLDHEFPQNLITR
jgi:hypothetical protein